MEWWNNGKKFFGVHNLRPTHSSIFPFFRLPSSGI